MLIASVLERLAACKALEESHSCWGEGARMAPARGKSQKSRRTKETSRKRPAANGDGGRQTVKKQRTNKLDKGKGKAFIDLPTVEDDGDGSGDGVAAEDTDDDMLDEDLELDDAAVAFAGGLDRKGITRCVPDHNKAAHIGC